MLERHQNHSWRAITLPVSSEGGAAPGRVAKATRRAQREVSLIVHDRIAHIGVPVVVLREKDGRAEVYGLSPPLAEDSALYLDAAHMLVVVRRLDRRNDLVSD